ncbi:DUF4224 domain-containing protein [Thauera butanivorans]|uniref:DUF4224 domain-containing protein n=1 Tax=Thauera butanivorans TaxID=86174 RepID=UPI0012F8E881|nr:DUF4224 domain-containing protein [Thauera butanivorans]
MILTHDQIVEITQRVRASAQRRMLDHLNIPYRQRPDGTPVVFEADIHAPAKERPTPPRLRLPEARGLLAGQGRQVASPRGRP